MSVVTILIVVGAAVAVLLAVFFLRRPSGRGEGEEKRAAMPTPAPTPEDVPVPAPVPVPTVASAPAQAAAPAVATVDVPFEEDDEEEENQITLVTLRVDDAVLSESERPNPLASEPPDADDDFGLGDIELDLEPHARTESFLADVGADEDHPTMTTDIFLVSASGHSDQGRRRKNNEDSCLLMHNDGIFFVADGMGGYEGGEIASQLAVDTIEAAFKNKDFSAKVHADVPSRPTQLAQAMQAANLAIWNVATDDPRLTGMGTTLVGARFALRKNRVYIGHVGDSRCYRFRDGVFRRLTVDHTLESLGHTGPKAKHLFRAVGIGAEMDIDIITAVPKPGDVYLFCSDGLTKMVKDQGVRAILTEHSANLDVACEKLTAAANEAGGKDNITVVLVAVRTIEQVLATPPR